MVELRYTEKNRVTDIKLLPSGEWKVFTENGDIVCEHVVNAAGSFGPEVGEMVGLKNIPSIKHDTSLFSNR